MIECRVEKMLQGADGLFNLCAELCVPTGEFSALFGKSGSGKTTILRMIAGLITPDEGRIVVDGEVWYDGARKINLPPQQRRIGFVFQDYALFPNMSVEANLLYALDSKKDRSRVDEILAITELTALKQEYPHRLSGGQKQRVALARALVREPKVLLLDEPLSALDASMRCKLQDELLRIQQHFKITTILVSHDLPEVYKLTKKVFELEHGQIIKEGTPQELFGGASISGKFKFVGEILSSEPSDIVFVLSVLVGQEIIKVVASKQESQSLAVGQRVILASKAFNPLIIPA